MVVVSNVPRTASRVLRPSPVITSTVRSSEPITPSRAELGERRPW